MLGTVTLYLWFVLTDNSYSTLNTLRIHEKLQWVYARDDANRLFTMTLVTYIIIVK